MAAVHDWQRLLADIATLVWRARRRAGAAADVPGALARVRRDLEALADRLDEGGIEVLDHTGEPYDPGKSLRVLSFQPMPGAAGESIGETVKPTVYYHGDWLQMAEVIVHTPPVRSGVGEEKS
jgi:hypothetical protein